MGYVTGILQIFGPNYPKIIGSQRKPRTVALITFEHPKEDIIFS